jgi:hypothetical protein
MIAVDATLIIAFTFLLMRVGKKEAQKIKERKKEN